MITVDLGGDQGAGEVVARPLSPLGDERGVVGHKVTGCLYRRLGDIGHAVVSVHHVIAEHADAVPVGCGYPHYLGDHVHRELACECLDEVEGVRLQRGLQMLDGDGGDGRLELADAPRTEALRYESA